ncbi:MAG: polyribonucleotide nucleotidyltransferase [Patescibacteria group bacterium]
MLERTKFETTVAGKKIIVEFNPIASQANGSVMVRMGDTIILGTAVMSKNARESIDFFPLVVDYEEKYYAAGRILGSRFVRREGRPSEEAVLISRLIDRTIRPLFDHRIRNDVQVVLMALSVDEENSPDIPAIMAASLALGTSNIPWDGPVAGARIAHIDGNFVVNPTDTERALSEMDLIIAGGHGHINMIEGKAKEIPEERILQAFETALKEIDQLSKFQEEIISKIGKEKSIPKIEEVPAEAHDSLQKHFRTRIGDAMYTLGKKEREHALSDLKFEWMESIKERCPELSKGMASLLFEETIDETVHERILTKGERPDGRHVKEVRPLLAETSLLPRAHGSGLFFRGDTHILSTVTLGAPGDELLIEGMDVRTKKHFIHHYNFPPFSVGETGRMGSPGRREIGHGALAEKALEAIIPPKEVFPYTIRIVSETLSSNGSSSMGSVCASLLALMDAGVPIKKPVAGIAMGLMMESDTNYKVLTDLQGPEDHHGDMDFKAAGTKDGLTAIQMDVKVKGVTLGILKDALADAKDARMKIMSVLLECIGESRKTLSPYAPRIIQMQIPIDKIRDVIGPGGKTINEIIAETGAQIDIEQTGDIYITGMTQEAAEKAQERIALITKEIEVGTIYKGKVTRIFEFGAMVEVAPKQEGLVHISELAHQRVNKVSDVVQVGDEVTVQVTQIDSLGRINLSIKALTEKPDGMPDEENHKPRPQHRR